jgi:hypothetical protein
MIRITHMTRGNVAKVAQHLGNLITLTWCGTEVTIAEVTSE